MEIKISNIFKHIKLVMHHKWVVFKLCCKVGIPWRGFMHDWSKFSPIEFWESVKYYDGHKSPITVCKEKNGYSNAWLHHKGRNKHHFQYWVDLALPQQAIIMPYEYAVEMVCDQLAAGIIYGGDKWTKEYQLNYYMNRESKNIIHPQIDKYLKEIFTQVSQNGIDATLTKKNIREIYDKYCVRMENLDENKI